MGLAFKISSTESSPQTLQQLQQELAALMSALQEDNENLTALQQQLQQLEQEGGANPPKGIAKQIANVKAEIAAAQAKLSGDQTQLQTDENELSVFCATAPRVAVGEEIEKTSEENAAKVNEERQLAYQNLADEETLIQLTGADALKRLNNITGLREQIDDLNEDIKVLNAAITILAIKVAGTWGLDGDADARLAQDVVTRNADEAARSDDEARLGVEQQKLAADLNTLFSLSTDAIAQQITKLLTDVQKILHIILSGNHNEADLHEVSDLLAEVMSILQMIVTKFQQRRSEDNQWMTRANTDNQEVANNKSQAVAKAEAQLAQFASSLQRLLTAARYATEALSVLTAVTTGGASMIAMAVLMVALTETGVFGRASDALADKIGHGAIWAKVVADIVITVACIVVTHNAGMIGSKLAQSAASATRQLASASEEALEIEMAEINGAARAPGALPAAADQGAEQAAAQGAKAKSFLMRLAEALQKSANMDTRLTARQAVGMGTAYFAANNGVVDLAEMLAAIHTHEINKTKEQLEQQRMFQILALVAAAVQVLTQFAAIKYGLSDTQGGSNVIGQMMGDNLPAFMQTCYIIQALASWLQACSSGALVANSVYKGYLQEDQGAADSVTSIYKTLGQMNKLYEQKQIELFASKMQQMIEEVSTMIKRFGQAEQEAARVLEQTAV
jgi:polyhydroxyalkanoate synthesis regulator phasin